MKIAIIQSNYIPWKGYFDIINDVDAFYFLDNVQYTRNDWRNRNKIKIPGGTMWLTIPVGSGINRLISEVAIRDNKWALKHWKTITHLYSKAPYFKLYREFFEYIYMENKWESLSAVNQYLIKTIALEFLKIKVKFMDLSGRTTPGEKLDRLINIIRLSGADDYISGPNARDYIDESRFAAEGIKLIYKDYSDYPEYLQFFPPFDNYVSIIDLLFHVGPDAPYYIWGWREDIKEQL